MDARFAIILAAGCACCAATLAGAEVAPGGWVDSRMVGSQLEMRDVTNGRALIARQGLGALAGFPAGVVTETTVVPAASGADVRVTARNTASTAKRLGRIYAGILNMGPDVEYFNFRHTGTPVSAHTTTHTGWAAMYPDDLYSPVAVLRNRDIAVGMSIQYPVMDYKHDVRVEISSPGNWLAEGEAGRGWLVSFGLSNINQEGPLSTIQHEAQLQPGEERTYTVSIRFSKNPVEWQQTLVPYRDFFRETYGPVKYARETTPVLAYALSDPGFITAINPLGYRPNHRPDLNGFAGVLRELGTYEQWPTVMLWAPTGLYRTHRDLNWPYQFASHWDTTAQQRTAFSPDGFPSLVARGQEVGMWWGRSLNVAATWDTAESTPFNPSNPSHRTLALAELDAAARAGATWIGLDTFAHHVTPIWESRQWLRDMKAAHPEMRFVTEPSMCDIMHVETPTFISGWNAVTSRPASRSDLFNITTPNYLADFLLPGHETWGAFRYSEHTRFFGAPTGAQVRADMERIASLGYRPCFAIDYFTPQGINAAQGWESSVPQSIRTGDQWMADIRAGRLPGQATDMTPPADPGAGSGSGSGGGAGGTDAVVDTGGQGAGASAPQRTRTSATRSSNSSSALRRSIVRVQQSGGGSQPTVDSTPTTGGPGAGPAPTPPPRMSINWRDIIRRNAQYRVQQPRNAIDRIKDRATADAGGD